LRRRWRPNGRRNGPRVSGRVCSAADRVRRSAEGPPREPRGWTLTAPNGHDPAGRKPPPNRTGIMPGVIAWDPREGGTCFLTKIRCSPTSSSGMHPSIS
jgi:hypothetical protein